MGSEVAAPLLRIVARGVSPGLPSPPATWRKGLILSHTHLGDVLYRTCSLGALKAGLPDCEWDFLTSPLGAEVLAGNPAIREVLPLQMSEDSWSLSSRAMREIGARGYDVILCTNTVRHYADFLTALRLRVPNRVGFIDKGFSGVLSFGVESSMPRAYPDYFRTMVSAVIGTPPAWPLKPQIFPGIADVAAAERAWAGLDLDCERPVIACTLTTRQPGGQWPSELFLRSLEIAHGESGAQIVFCGSIEDTDSLYSAAARCSVPSVVLAGALGIRGFAAFLQRCSVLLAMDSGPRHVANAVSTPVVFLRNATYLRAEAGSYADTEVDAAPLDELVGPERVRYLAAKIDPAAIAGSLIKCMNEPRCQ
ncbi:MAG: glycosyltransferase family 9 protein [Gemmatimonadaceae bacterium]|nr:glycosyltransferase family 9 protein [Gemmatimonadaceae bacterium]